jgi:outer membrane protein assembly factor BamB
MPAPAELSPLWTAQFGQRTSAPVIAGGSVYVAVVNEGRICALDGKTGRQRWSFAASSRIDTPPTIDNRRCLFGSHDGYVYCLDANNGELLWRYNAAPEHRRIVAYDRVESPWPVMGSVLVHKDMACAVAGRLTRVDGGMDLVALDPETGRTIWRHHLTGIYGEEAHVLPQSWYIHEEHMTNNILLGKGNAIRLYDEFGTWQFNVRDGRLEGRSSDVPQPGWPQGRRTPYNKVASERWTWCGWDRVTAAELLAGEDTYNSMAHGMQPYSRNTPKYEAWLFPAPNRWGINGIRKNKEKQFVLQPAKFTERHLDSEKMPWPPRVLHLDVKSYAFIEGGDTLLVAGGTPVGPIHRGGELRMISMANGRDRTVARLPAASIFDGIAAAHGRVFVSTVDGQVVCLGDAKAVDEAMQMRSAKTVSSQR